MISLIIEKARLDGAKQVLRQLSNDFCFYLIPTIYLKTKAGNLKFTSADAKLPVDLTKAKIKQRLYGDAIVDLLLSDDKSLTRYLNGTWNSIKVTVDKRDKKGKIIKLRAEFI